MGDFDDIGMPSLPADPDGSRALSESSSQSVGDNPPMTVQKNPNNPLAPVQAGLFPESFTVAPSSRGPSMLGIRVVVRVVHGGY